MAGLFSIPNRNINDSAILKKAKSTKKAPTTKRGGGIASKIANIQAIVEKYLGKYVEETLIVQDEETLIEYIDKCIKDGEVGIDTETTGLDPMLDELVGISIYTHDSKTAYIPLNHKSYVTGQKSKNQLSIEFVAEQFQRLEDAKIFNVLFNAPFDIRFIMNGLGVRLHCDWDCYLAARCLNENEESNALKKLHQKYLLKGKEDAFKFDELFKGITFDYVPIKTGGIYAAHDSKITLDYKDYQQQFLYYEPDKPFEDRNGMNGVAWVFFNIEMPMVDVIVDMEQTGIEFDFEYNNQLKEKYHKLLEEREAKFHELCEMYSEEIENYSGNVQLESPINIKSSQQLAVLLYDIMKLEAPVDKKTKKPVRSTNEETLKKLKNPIADAILDYREFSTIVSTFIDKLPECVNPNDGRIHCKFNQYGADTGRMSSRDPNLQNIPSHNKEIRKMFKATDGYVMMSSDFSQQEVKGMAQMCGDETMAEAFRQGKDFYAQIASVAFELPYEECLEHFPKGSYIKHYSGKWHYGTEKDYDKIADGETDVYADGKERRGQAKSILLGINYGRGAASIAEQLGCTKQKAEKIKSDVFEGFPAIEKFESDSKAMAEELGYVTTLWGRKRRLPVMTLPDYEFSWAEGHSLSDDPLDFDMSDDVVDDVPDEIINKYCKRLANAWGDKKKSVIAQAREEGIIITDHTKERIDATRQIVNSRIQGTAADQSKLAMIALNNDARLKELGFRMLIPVHDEVIAECPEENAKEVAERFAYIMSHSGGSKFTIPISCDVSVSKCWYGEEIQL